jgi:hypothetical protein
VTEDQYRAMAVAELETLSRNLDIERRQLQGRIKLVNDVLAVKQDAIRRALPANPKGLARLGRK